ncbi:hypothetical protein T492DRAFT_883535, partial [Pavlovales sp. CCMP2436]
MLLQLVLVFPSSTRLQMSTHIAWLSCEHPPVSIKTLAHTDLLTDGHELMAMHSLRLLIAALLLMATPAHRLAARVSSLGGHLARVGPQRAARARAQLSIFTGHSELPPLSPRGLRPLAASYATDAHVYLPTFSGHSAPAPPAQQLPPQLRGLPPQLPQPPQPRATPPPRDPWGPHAVEGVTIVRTEAEAHRVLAQLMTLTAETGRYHAIDTETHGVDLKKVGPVGNGEVICLSIYCGEDLDFGTGPCVWVDNWSRSDELGDGVADGVAGVGEEGAHVRRGHKTNLLRLFDKYLADPQIRKVLHNLSFDRHMLANEGLAVHGFAGDTMHMARLWDSSLSKQSAAASALSRAAEADRAGGVPAAGYNDAAYADASIAAGLAEEGEEEEGATAAGYSLAALTSALLPKLAKRPMKEIFGVRKLKLDGTPGKVVTLPDPLVLQLTEDSRAAFILYSAHDAKATWHLRNDLEHRLRGMPWGRSSAGARNMFDYYVEFTRPFGDLLVDIEANGFKIDVGRLPAVQAEAEAVLREAEANFRQWASSQCAHAKWMNIGSSAQLAQLLFAPPRPSGQAGGESLLPAAALKTLCAWAPPAVLEDALGAARAAELLAPAAKSDSDTDDESEPAAAAVKRRPAGPGRPPAGAAEKRPFNAPALALPVLRSFKVAICEEMRKDMAAELLAVEAALLAAVARAGVAAPEAGKLATVRSKALAALARRKHTQIQLGGLGVPPPILTKGGSPSTSSGAINELVKSGA